MIADRIRDMIFLEKKYTSGDKLPNEYEIKFHARRQPDIFERSNKNTCRQRNTYDKAWKLALLYRKTTSTSADIFSMKYLEDKKKLVKHWFEFRLILEPQNARLAALNATDKEIEEICAAAEHTTELIKNNQPILKEDQHFHALIATATKNDVIKLTLPSLENAVSDAIQTSTQIGTSKKGLENVELYHPSIAKFIQLRDPDGAEMAMRFHILRGLKDLG